MLLYYALSSDEWVMLVEVHVPCVPFGFASSYHMLVWVNFTQACVVEACVIEGALDAHLGAMRQG